MGGHDNSNRFLGRIRSSKPFTYTVVNSAVFTDAYIYGLIIPVLPFALVERVHLPESEVQEWIGILLGAYGAGLMVGSRKLCTFPRLLPPGLRNTKLYMRTLLTPHHQQSPACSLIAPIPDEGHIFGAWLLWPSPP